MSQRQSVPADVAAALQRGDMTGAARLARQHMAAATRQALVQVQVREDVVHEFRPPAGAAASGLEAGVPPDALEALRQGDFNRAMKLTREHLGSDQQTAARLLKQIVAGRRPAAASGRVVNDEEARRQRGSDTASSERAVAMARARPPTVAPGDVPGDVRWVVIAAIVLMALAWFWP